MRGQYYPHLWHGEHQLCCGGFALLWIHWCVQWHSMHTQHVGAAMRNAKLDQLGVLWFLGLMRTVSPRLVLSDARVAIDSTYHVYFVFASMPAPREGLVEHFRDSVPFICAS